MNNKETLEIKTKEFLEESIKKMKSQFQLSKSSKIDFDDLPLKEIIQIKLEQLNKESHLLKNLLNHLNEINQ